MPDIKCSAAFYADCKQEMLAFKNKNRSLRRDESYSEWRYVQRPNGAEPLVVWAEAENRKIGSLSLIPHHFAVDGRDCLLGVLGDISVSADWRGRGVAGKMFGFLAELEEVKKLDACVVLPNKEAARPLEKAGWVKISKLQRHVKVLYVRKNLGSLKDGLAWALAPVLNAVLGLSYHSIFSKMPSSYTVELIEKVDSRFDDLWSSIDKRGLNLSCRNMEYLQWRYSSHPLTKYNFFTLSQNSKLLGYIVFHYNGDVCHIDDYLGVQEDIDHLVSFFVDHVKKARSAKQIVFYRNSSSLLDPRLNRHGFFSRNDFLAFMVDPKGSRTPGMGNSLNWFLTAGDKDV